LLAQDATMAVDLEVDGVQVLAQRVDALSDCRAVLEQQLQSGRTAGLTSLTQRRELPHPRDRHARCAQVNQKRKPVQVFGGVPRWPPTERATDGSRPCRS